MFFEDILIVKKEFKVGVIGHRKLEEQDNYFILLACHEIFSDLKKKYNQVSAVSALSQGADSLFAKSAIDMGIKLESVIPFQQFASDFREQESYERFKNIRNQSDIENIMNFSERSGAAYRKSMEWVIIKSDVIVAIWDGREFGTMGGTWEAVTLCKKMKKKLIHINILKKNIDIFFISGFKYTRINNINSRNIYRYV